MVLKQRKWSFLLIAALSVLLVGLLARVVLAQTATPEAETGTSPALSDSLSRRGLHHGLSDSSAHDEYLAEALGITVEQLQAARRQAMTAYLADAVTAGDITQEQADLMLAKHALRDVIDQEALLAEALGMTVEELAAALAGGKSLSELMTAAGIDADTLRTNVQTAYEAAVARAVADGVITQAQADAVLAQQSNGFGLFGGHGFGGHGGGGRGHHGRGGSWSLPSVPSAPDSDSDDTTTDTGFDA
jgi:lambda repressor-like predicted transcriptional regulator